MNNKKKGVRVKNGIKVFIDTKWKSLKAVFSSVVTSIVNMKGDIRRTEAREFIRSKNINKYTYRDLEYDRVKTIVGLDSDLKTLVSTLVGFSKYVNHRYLSKFESFDTTLALFAGDKHIRLSYRINNQSGDIKRDAKRAIKFHKDISELMSDRHAGIEYVEYHKLVGSSSELSRLLGVMERLDIDYSAIMELVDAVDERWEAVDLVLSNKSIIVTDQALSNLSSELKSMADFINAVSRLMRLEHQVYDVVIGIREMIEKK